MGVHLRGTCGNCGGQVCVPEVWYGIYPPTPTCRSCGSTPVNAHGPVIPMNPPSKRQGVMGRPRLYPTPGWSRGVNLRGWSQLR